MRAIIFVNGVIDEYGWLKKLIQDDDVLICADGGTDHCLACDKTPHIVVGDMDSIDAETIAFLKEQNVRFEEYPTAKDETDLELAVEAAIKVQKEEGKIEQVLLVGALGGRLDQTLANLFLLAQRDWPLPIQVVDRAERVQIVRAGEMLNLCGRVDDIVSAIPLSETVTGITYTGLRYPLEDVTLHMGSTRGISNEFVAEEATVSIRSGRLLIIHQTVQR